MFGVYDFYYLQFDKGLKPRAIFQTYAIKLNEMCKIFEKIRENAFL